MQVRCDYCGKYINDTDNFCTNCGAPNMYKRVHVTGIPSTIEEFQAWYAQKNLPPSEVTRYFIGKNLSEPKVFGIYKDENTGNFVVYKNKADGTRSIRYEGKDEAFAVNELYQRLLSEIANQKARNR